MTKHLPNLHYTLGAESADDVLNTDQKAQLMEHLKKMKPVTAKSLEEGNCDDSHQGKFLGTHELITGALKHSTQGLQSFLCISTEYMKRMMLNPEKTIIEEVNNLGDPEIIGLLDYIINQPVSEKVYKNAGKDSTRDKGRAPGTCLKDFMQNENAIKGNLNRWHVIALRLYTTKAYKFINDPLRDMKRKDGK